MKKIFIAMIIVALSIFAVGCEKKEVTNIEAHRNSSIIDEVGNETKNETVTSPQKGGSLSLSMRITQTLNPLVNEDESVDKILKLIYEPLIKLDENMKPVPNIAESWSFSEDGTIMTINLKSNIAWDNGDLLDADDVVFSMDTIRYANENVVYKKCLENVVSYSKIGSNAVSIVFNQSFSGNTYYMCFPIISAKHYRGTTAFDIDKNLQPVGSGPYKFESFVASKELNLVSSSTAFNGEPYIDKVKVVITPDAETDLYSFDQGIVNAVSAEETDMGKYENSKNAKRYEYTTNYYDFIGFNFNKTIFQDKNMRKAIAYALPKQKIVESVYLNHAVEARTPMNPKSWLYEHDTSSISYNLNEAKRLLDEAKWIDSNGDKVRDRTTNEYNEVLKLNILVNIENEERCQTAVKLSDELNAIGFDATIDRQPYDKYVEKLNNKDFDLFIGGWKMSVVPNMNFMFHSSQTDGGKNFISYKNENMDNLLSNAHSAVGEVAILQAYSNLQKFIAEELPYISLVFRNSAVFTSKNFYGEIKPLESNIFDSIQNWYTIEENIEEQNK